MKIDRQAAMIVTSVLKDYDGPTKDFTERETKMLDALYDCAEGIVRISRELDTLKAKTEGGVHE